VRRAEIQPGRFYRARIYGRGDDEIIRVESMDLPPRWEGDRARIEATRFLAGGPLRIRLEPRAVMYPQEPDAKLSAIIRTIEEGGSDGK
jgi:hypothetical protein